MPQMLGGEHQGGKLLGAAIMVSLPDTFGDLTSLTRLDFAYPDESSGASPAGNNMPAALKSKLTAQGCSGNGW